MNLKSMGFFSLDEDLSKPITSGYPSQAFTDTADKLLHVNKMQMYHPLLRKSIIRISAGFSLATRGIFALLFKYPLSSRNTFTEWHPAVEMK